MNTSCVAKTAKAKRARRMPRRAIGVHFVLELVSLCGEMQGEERIKSEVLIFSLDRFYPLGADLEAKKGVFGRCSNPRILRQSLYVPIPKAVAIPLAQICIFYRVSVSKACVKFSEFGCKHSVGNFFFFWSFDFCVKRL